MKLKLGILAGLLVLITLTASATLAIPQTAGRTHNVVTAGNIRLELIQEGTLPQAMPGTKGSVSLVLKNKGQASAYVRILLDAKLYTASGEEADGADLILPGLSSTHWVYRDGYYYYDKPLSPGESTESLLDSVRYSPKLGKEFSGGSGKLIYTAQAVQVAHNGVSPFTAAGWQDT